MFACLPSSHWSVQKQLLWFEDPLLCLWSLWMMLTNLPLYHRRVFVQEDTQNMFFWQGFRRSTIFEDFSNVEGNNLHKHRVHTVFFFELSFEAWMILILWWINFTSSEISVVKEYQFGASRWEIIGVLYQHWSQMK